jgi:hypothetical protein
MDFIFHEDSLFQQISSLENLKIGEKILLRLDKEQKVFMIFKNGNVIYGDLDTPLSVSIPTIIEGINSKFFSIHFSKILGAQVFFFDKIFKKENLLDYKYKFRKKSRFHSQNSMLLSCLDKEISNLDGIFF